MLGELTAQHRQAQIRPKSKAAANENLSEYYGLVENDKRIDVLSFRLRNGRIFYLHYAYRFNVDMPTNQTLVLLAHSAQIKVIIQGRGLQTLISPLLTGRITYIRESENPTFDDGQDVFISSITLNGKAFEI